MSMVIPLRYFNINVPSPSHSLRSMLENSAEKATITPSKASDIPKAPSLILTSMYESETAFTALVSVTLPAAGAAVSGLTVTPDLAGAAYSRSPKTGKGYQPINPAAESTHKVCISIAKPFPASLAIHLPWPVDASLISAKLSRSTGIVSLVLPKAKNWPEDWISPGLVQKVGLLLQTGDHVPSCSAIL